ncbi:MAG: dienelactone hydrolase family protein [Nitrospirota bacterium]
MRYLLAVIALLFGAAAVRAEVHTQTIPYRHHGTVLEGYLAYDDKLPGKRPGVLVVHEWWGITPFIKEKVEQLARMGFTAFAADIYGKGVRPKDPKEAAAQAEKYRSNRALLRERTMAGLEVLRSNEHTDPRHLAAIGFCFGGTAVLELARSGAPVAGVVSFHGGLATLSPDDAKNIKAKVLVLHGADDPFVPMKEVLAFQEEMRKAGADWQMNIYGNAVHSFTNPAAGNDAMKGTAYNEKADRRSWNAMKVFFAEIFK